MVDRVDRRGTVPVVAVASGPEGLDTDDRLVWRREVAVAVVL